MNRYIPRFEIQLPRRMRCDPRRQSERVSWDQKQQGEAAVASRKRAAEIQAGNWTLLR